MCGIIGTLPANETTVLHALASMRARGPDEERLMIFDFAALGIDRLAITDLANGSQPLRSSDGEISLVFNGAIYNHRELRVRFPDNYLTGNDGEVIHSLYRRVGLKFADFLEGIYAVILLDHRRQIMVLARDPLGIKPLYWARQGNELITGSTLAAFPPSYWPIVNEFPAGRVWSTSGEAHHIRPPQPPPSTLLETLRMAVLKQIPQEVRWGTMLSGGVDSALITALAAEVSQIKVCTYTLGAAQSTDAMHALKLGRSYDLEQTIIEFSDDDLEAAIDVTVRHCGVYDPGIIQNAAATYLTARIASQQGCKVLLTGEGADELFGGYDEHDDVPSELLNDTLLRWQENLSASECLRLDRSAMAAGIETRVPFLDEKVVALARSIPGELKISRQRGIVIRKHCLREAARQILPESIAMRAKEPFFRGSEVGRRIGDLVQRRVTDSEVEDYRGRFSEFPLPDAKAVYFFKLWRTYYPGLAHSWAEMQNRGLARRL